MLNLNYQKMNGQIETEIELETDDDYHAINVTCDFYYEPGDPGVWQYSNGDPGYPPTSEVIELLNAKDSSDVDYLPRLNQFQIDKIVQHIKDLKNDY